MNGNLDKAFNHYLLSSSIYRDLNKKIDEGDPITLEIYFSERIIKKPLNIIWKENIRRSRSIKQAASSTSNLASIYFQLDNFEKSLEYTTNA